MKEKQKSEELAYYRLEFDSRKLPDLFWQQLPQSPVVYGFEDEDNKPIYIGKTIHPKTRVIQHIKTNRFTRKARHLRIYPVNSDLESILLEARLIRLHEPVYNQIQKDDRSLLYVVIAKDEFPRVSLVRKNDLKTADEYFGPFTNGNQARTVLKLARRIFRYCENPGNKAKRPCFYRHLEMCSGACVGVVSAFEYRQTLGQLKRFLNGQTKFLLEEWRKQINRAARAKDFETAALIKKRYEALFAATQVNTRLSTMLESPPKVDMRLKQLKNLLNSLGIKTDLERVEIYDNATLAQTGTVGAMVVFVLGVKQPDAYRMFKISPESLGDTGAMREMLVRRMRRADWPTPDLIILDGGKGQLSAVEQVIPDKIARIALAKREETVVIRKDGAFSELVLPEGEAKIFLQQMRDEAHRFVNSYHARRRIKMLLK